METIKIGNRVITKTVGSSPRMIVGEVVAIEGNIIRFLLDEGQSEFGVRPVFSRPIHKIRRL